MVNKCPENVIHCASAVCYRIKILLTMRVHSGLLTPGPLPSLPPFFPDEKLIKLA